MIEKKGQLGIPAIIPMFFSIAVMIVMFLLLFFIISLIRGCDPEPIGTLDPDIQDELKLREGAQLLNTYLRSPANAEGKNAMMGQFIALAVKECRDKGDGCYDKTRLPDETKKIMNFLYPDKYWSINIMIAGSGGLEKLRNYPEYSISNRRTRTAEIFVEAALIPADYFTEDPLEVPGYDYAIYPYHKIELVLGR